MTYGPIDDRETERLLASQDGISYLIDPAGILLAVGEPAWTRFAASNDAPSLEGRAVIGKPLFSMIEGAEVRQCYDDLHAKLIDGSRSEVKFTYRCDSPAAQRYMRMSAAAIRRGSAVVGILYHSVILEEIARPPVKLITSSSVRRGMPKGDRNVDELVRVCSWCLRVKWPIGSATIADRSAWITAEDYAHRGGDPDRTVTHGICAACREAWTNAVD